MLLRSKSVSRVRVFVIAVVAVHAVFACLHVFRVVWCRVVINSNILLDQIRWQSMPHQLINDSVIQ